MNKCRFKFCLLALLVLYSWQMMGAVMASNTEAKPAAQLEVTVNTNRQLVFTVSYNGQTVIQESPLGLIVDNKPLGCQVKNLEQTAQKGDEATYLITQADGQKLLIDAREFNDGIALRYRIPAHGPVCIYDELTSFTFPSQTRAWYASGPFQYGWLQQYQERNTDEIKGELLAPPATFRLPQGIYAAITEANLFNYHGAVLLGSAPNCVKVGYVENKGHMVSGVITGLPDSKYWHEVVKGVPWVAYPKEGAQEVVTPW
ncbi:MAG: glycoside hydrolase family 97 N-terminal domain-containing protein, partial [Muribaculaceae bacterium]